MRALWQRVLIVGLSLAGLTTALADPAGFDESGSGWITGTVVNIRSGPGTGYAIVTRLGRNSEVTRLGPSQRDRAWERIRLHDDREAYVFAGLLGTTPPVDKAALKRAQRERFQRDLALLPEDAPRFDDYPVAEVYRGRPAAVDLDSLPGSRRFRTNIRNGAAEGPNFAGDLTIITWGCGTSCQMSVLVEARSGRIIGSFGTASGTLYDLHSRLLVVDLLGATDEACVTCGTLRFYAWDGQHLQPIAGTRSALLDHRR